MQCYGLDQALAYNTWQPDASTAQMLNTICTSCHTLFTCQPAQETSCQSFPIMVMDHTTMPQCYRKRAHWAVPMTLLSSFAAGVALAIDHHYFYSTLRGQVVDESTTQQYNISIGTAFSLLVQAALVSLIFLLRCRTGRVRILCPIILPQQHRCLSSTVKTRWMTEALAIKWGAFWTVTSIRHAGAEDQGASLVHDTIVFERVGWSEDSCMLVLR